MAIHPLAHVDPGAEVAPGAVVGPFAVVGAGAVLSEGVEVMAHAAVLGPSEIGPGTRVFPGAVLGADPQDLAYRGEATRLVVGAGNTFREGATVHRGGSRGDGDRGGRGRGE